MPKKPEYKPDDPEQFKRFVETAREVEADEKPETFERAFVKIVKTPLPKQEQEKD